MITPRPHRHEGLLAPWSVAALVAGLVLSLVPTRADAASARASYRPAVLRVSAIPDEAPTELVRKFGPLGAYLEGRLGLPVTFRPVADYAATVEALAARTVDLVWYGGFTHVQARHRLAGGAVALVMRREDLRFKSYFITRPGTGIRGLGDLKGRSVLFGSVSSTSGHLMPRYYLQQAGLEPERDFGRVGYSGAHDATAKAVEGGRVDAGVLNYRVWEKLVGEGKVDPGRVVVFWATPEYADYNWTVRADLDAGLREGIAAAFLALDGGQGAHRAILALQQATGYVRATPGMFAGIEAAARAAGLLK